MTDDGPEHDEDADEQDLVVVLRLSNRQLGTAAERTALEELAQRLEEAVQEAGAGEYDGEEIGGGECLLFFAGPDAEVLFTVLQPVLKKHELGRAARVRLQVGDDIVERVV